MNEDLELLFAERAIQRVLTTYSRAVDRYDFELLRSCYWPDGTDDHGSFVGGVDGFIPFVQRSLNRFERTAHFLGNILTPLCCQWFRGDRSVASASASW